METKDGVKPSPRRRRMVLGIGIGVAGLMVVGLVGLRLAGGGSGSRRGFVQRGGLNAVLPGAHLRPEKARDKLDMLEKAGKDSMLKAARVRGDVFGRFSLGSVGEGGEGLAGSAGRGAADSSAGRLERQLEGLRRLVRPGAAGGAAPGVGLFRPGGGDVGRIESPARERLEELLRGMRRPDTGRSDPQLDRLSGMLDKIIKIQRGGDVSADSNKVLVAAGGAAMRLEQPLSGSVVSILADDGGEGGGGFFGIDGTEERDSVVVGNAFAAVIPSEQVVVAGATVAVRLLNEARIGGVLVPGDELLYGKAALSGDRLLVTINSVRVGPGVYPVALQVYDLDGLAGIHVPGAITREVLKQSAAAGVNGVGMVTPGGSLAGSAADAGVVAARAMLSRKVAIVRVTVPAGYRVFLKNQKNL